MHLAFPVSVVVESPGFDRVSVGLTPRSQVMVSVTVITKAVGSGNTIKGFSSIALIEAASVFSRLTKESFIFVVLRLRSSEACMEAD